MNGPTPIEWPDIDAFLRRSGETLSPPDIRLIEQLDDIYLADHYRSREGTERERQQALKDGLRQAGKRPTQR